MSARSSEVSPGRKHKSTDARTDVLCILSNNVNVKLADAQMVWFCTPKYAFEPD